MENEMRSIKLYEQEILTLLSLPDEQRGKIIKAILSERVEQEIPELDAMETAVYTLVLGQIKRAEELSRKRKQSINSRWKNEKDQTEDTNNIQESYKDDTNDIQNHTNDIQTSYKSDTNAYTNTNTITNTNTNTITNTLSPACAEEAAACAAEGENAADAAGSGGDSYGIIKRFEAFWEAYPKKTSKQNARSVWEKLKPDEKLTSTILEALERFKKTEQWQRDNGRYIPYPASWLNQRRWEDEPEQPVQQPNQQSFRQHGQPPAYNDPSGTPGGFGAKSSFNVDKVMEQIYERYRRGEK